MKSIQLLNALYNAIKTKQSKAIQMRILGLLQSAIMNNE